MRIWQQVLVAGWWLIGARSLAGMARLAAMLKSPSRESQLVSDLMAGLIYAASVLAIVDLVFAVPVGGLLATSGIIAIVLGLALQSTLGDVFSGIAVGIERPYCVGDLISVEGGIEGRVTLVTWRSTHVATGKDNMAIIPNSIIAKARLVNHSLPTTLRRDAVELALDASVPPEHAIATLTAAARSANLLLATPLPEACCLGLRGDGNDYQVRFSVASSARLSAARSELLTEIHRHLRHSGISLAVAGLATVAQVAVPGARDLLAQSDLFGLLDSGQRELLAQHLQTVVLQAGEVLIHEGSEAEALFIVAAGAAEVTTDVAGARQVLHRMRPGESIGAIALITATPYAATTTAVTALRVYRLDRQAIAAAITAAPGLAEGLEALARRGQAAMAADAVSRSDQRELPPELLLSKLRGFVQVLLSR
ncbi:small-conductance mechanosensitive channel [Duganella sp. SG902]|uniref:cyclic nucleotide-binding domain-containing protein n=1 Tax=Duganella sp. SG902 TaxID=2587016 RepID=UPI0017F72F2A|nr:small-conductance mechanosensitive channel [Duganella sp. SG902]